ncbi:MAG: YchF family ATPase, partial [Myxococcales bacterium]|nr:YchF family ATPase [Myxococcales bacterium]
ADIETIETELVLKDLETVEKRLDRARRAAKGQNAIEKKAVEICEKLVAHLDGGALAAAFDRSGCDDDEKLILREMFLLTDKPLFYVVNVSEEQLSSLDTDPHVGAVRARAEKLGAPVVPISAKIEAEIMQLPEDERADFLESVGLEEPGLHQVIRTGYEMLDLITFFTAGDPEVHAWTIKAGTKAPQAAGKIHSDFERGFIKAEVMFWKDLVDLKTEAAVKAAGKLGIEGKEYVVRDGDVVHFRFNV